MTFNSLLPLMMAGPQGEGSNPIPMMGMMLLIFGIFYVMMIRPQQRKEKERRKMIEALRVGQRVLFSGGMIGTVKETKENTLMIEISAGVVVEVARGAISRVLKDGEKVSTADTP